ncbi:6-phospho-beta-glucosidase [Paenarthrobacter aurescens]|uniref:6-phospho-beta-glucosidase n=1 Tax=Paenarthrobacter aurescens TaxID=43663 RepID=A0A4Y3NFN8_PAEAU|nr:6-phospho-beta-glucosidase [Paenarthrobacter aurescens]MDO6144297.1 6-phospho-beta-glucosidase [Paenarthrobacter aurescens]MDO6148144.1 6-phospho-beta-glucosidase [Paenarthrobacter aurescens]MDO6159388.1 6-phospho-beta-glucosidase [Paenarthrobacter aurescens]MDO6163371.1 6-phospho-beta-glucosidase [Paenarthrobacter aurescens]GEB17858.1 6-phospho-beta-glucosidase [Paenarthrobacter aurescens]
MRLMIAGGGGFRVPLVYRALCEGPFAGLVDELVLYDVDEVRLAAIEAVLGDMPADASGPTVMVSTDLREALTGTDMVFAAIRPGGTAGRIADEQVPLSLGLLGQETTGAGGISYALRSIPRMLELAEAMRERCPEAWLINFTNPAGMVTEALVPVLGKRVIGICDSAGGLVQRAARAAGAPLTEGMLDGVGYYGLNHLGWLYRLAPAGRDLLPALLSDHGALESMEEGRLFGQHTLLQLGCLPNEYLYYYYQTPQATKAIGEQRETRGASIHGQQQSLYPSLLQASHPYRLWDSARRSREEGYLAEARTHGEQRDETDLAGGGYERVALSAMRALSGGGTAQLILNVPNSPVSPAGPAAQVAVPGLPADAVVEVPCEVTTDGALPLAQDRPGGQFLTLMQHIKEVERLTIRAVVSGGREAAVQAFAAHPLVGSRPLGEELLEGYEAAFPELTQLWG